MAVHALLSSTCDEVDGHVSPSFSPEVQNRMATSTPHQQVFLSPKLPWCTFRMLNTLLSSFFILLQLSLIGNAFWKDQTCLHWDQKFFEAWFQFSTHHRGKVSQAFLTVILNYLYTIIVFIKILIWLRLENVELSFSFNCIALLRVLGW